LRDRLIFILKYVIGFVLLAWLLLKIDQQILLETFLELELSTIILVILLAILNLVFQFSLWRYLVVRHSKNYRIKDLIPSFFAGFALRLMIPGGHAEITKVFLLQGKKRGKVIAFGIEKSFNTYLKIILICFALPLVMEEYKIILWSIGSVLIVGLVFLPLLLARERLQKHQEKTVSYFAVFIISFLHSIPIFLCMTTQYFLLLNQSYEIAFFDTIIVSVFVWGAGLIPISVSGLGVRENLAVYFLAFFAIPAAVAVGVSLSVFIVNMILPAIVGVFMIMHRRDDIKQGSAELKKMGKEVMKKGRVRLRNRDLKTVVENGDA